MASFKLLHFLALVSLAICHPFDHDKRFDSDGIPFGAFPISSSTPATWSPSSSAVASTPTPEAVSPDAMLLGRAIVQNNCKFPVYLWPVGRTIHTMLTIAPSSKYSEVYRSGEGGIALKISTERDGLLRHAPLMIFAYNLAKGQVWFDLSDVSGDPFKGHRVEISPSNPHISWTDGQPPGGSQIRVLNSSTNIVLTLC